MEELCTTLMFTSG